MPCPVFPFGRSIERIPSLSRRAERQRLHATKNYRGWELSSEPNIMRIVITIPPRQEHSAKVYVQCVLHSLVVKSGSANSRSRTSRLSKSYRPNRRVVYDACLAKAADNPE